MVNSADFRKIFKLLPAPGLILLADAPKFTIAEVNDACANLVNTEAGALIGRPVFEIFRDNIADWENTLKSVVDDKLPHQTPGYPFELLPRQRADMHVKYYDILSTPVLNNDNEVEYIICCVTDKIAVQDASDKKLVELALLETQNEFQSLVQTVDGIVWEADANTFEFTFISDKVESILGYTVEEWLSDPEFWKKHIYPEDVEQAVIYCHNETQKGHNHTFDYRMIKANAEIVWLKDIVSVVLKNGKPERLRGLMLDITQTKRFTELDRLEKTILELNAQKNSSIEDILSFYLHGIEKLFDHLHFSIVKIKDNHLFNWAAPSLPKGYVDSIENLPIGPNAGSCGTAAYYQQAVIVSDIENDERWKDYKHFALSYGLRACFSYPIINSEGETMAVFGVYHHEKRQPQEDEIKIVERSAAILKIILENRQNSGIITETALLMEQGQELANFGNWSWDIQNNVVKWSDTLYKIYGLNKSNFKATFEGYQELLHPDDRERIYNYIMEILAQKKDSVFEERIIRPNGEIRHLKSWGKLQLNDQGQPIRMIGACLDITENKTAELQLNELHKQLEEHLEILSTSEKQYSDLFHLSPQPMWIYDCATLKFLNVNDAAIKHYGYTRDEFLQMTINEVRPEEEIPRLAEALCIAAKEEGRQQFGIFKHRKKNGEIMLVDIQSNLMSFGGKKACIVLASDVTERQNYIMAVETQNKKLQEIAWIQSHVVRAPLARVMSLIELLNNDWTTDVESGDILEKITSSAYELDQIIRNITDRAADIELIPKTSAI